MREYGPGRPLVFNHIPKTAGTSLATALHQILDPALFVGGIDLALVGGYDDIDGVRPSARTAIYFKPEDMPADATFVSGHIAPGTTMPRYPGADHITLVRSPQVRSLSQWLHGRSLSDFSLRHWGPSADAFRVARLPLADYLQHKKIAPNIDNTVTRFLAFPNPSLERTEFIDEKYDDELLAAAITRIDMFDHVDVIENPNFMTDLGVWLGHELPQTRANERTSVPARGRPDLIAELKGAGELLDYRSRIDTQVWSYVARRAMPNADPAEVLAATMQKATDRYVTMLDGPADPLTLRRAVARVYDFGFRLNPRRHSGLPRS